MKARALLLILSAALITGCATVDHRAALEQQAEQLRGQTEVISTPTYKLQTLQVMPGKSQTLRIYIEGDGRAWATRSRPSLDPTPTGALVLDLMAMDPSTDKAYLARPCQFVKTPLCSIPSWTHERFSADAVKAMGDAVEQLMQKGNYQRLELVGFSGGAAIALIVAAQRKDVASVRTVAGNLDPAYINQFHSVSEMPTAISPLAFTQSLSHIPQLHFLGAEDRVVPLSIYDHYRAQFALKTNIKRIVVEEASHNKGWRKSWPELLATPL